MTTWGHLTQKHPTYNAKLWSLLETLYEGGFDITEEFKSYILKQHPNESDTLYTERKQSASYINYFGQVVDFFAAKLFMRQMSVTPSETGDAGDDKEGTKINTEAYDEFAEDADGEGNDFQQLMAKSFITACTMGKAIVAVDFPAKPDVEVVNRATEEALGQDKPRAFWVHPAMLLDWKLDDKGRFVFAVLHSQTEERSTFEGKRDKVIDRFKVWEMAGEGDAARAHWRVFELSRDAKASKKAPGDNDEVPEVTPPTSTSFKRVPLVVFDLPKGLWVGNKVGPMVCEHFQRRTMLISAQNKSLMAIPVVKLGSELGAPRREMPSEVQQQPGRGHDPASEFKAKGFVRIGKDDDIIFAEPSGSAYQIASEQLKELVDEIFRVSHQMAQSISATSQALARSGFSKAEDRNVAETVLEAFGEKVGQFATRIYDTIAEARSDDVFWTVHGLSEFRVSGDRAQTIDEAKGAKEIKVPSKLFMKRYWVQTALRVLGDNISPEDEQEIRREIESAVDAMPDPADEAARPPPPPQLPPGAPPPPPGGPQPPGDNTGHNTGHNGSDHGNPKPR